MNKFDKENHQYYINDVPVPSITQVMPEQNFYMPESELAKRREEGNENHSLIKMYFDTQKTFDMPLLIALDKFLEKNADLLGSLVLHEKPLYSIKHKYAGTADAIFENAIIDFKRSFGNSKYHALQLAGQMILAKENKLILKTKKLYVARFDGEQIKKRAVYNDKAEDTFLSLVKRHHIDRAVENYFNGG